MYVCVCVHVQVCVCVCVRACACVCVWCVHVWYVCPCCPPLYTATPSSPDNPPQADISYTAGRHCYSVYIQCTGLVIVDPIGACLWDLECEDQWHGAPSIEGSKSHRHQLVSI